MTVISLGEKLKKPVEEPLVAGQHTPVILPPRNDVEIGRQRAATFRVVAVRKNNPYTTVCVFFLGMMVLSTGILGGLYCFQHWGRKPAFLHIQRLRGIFAVPGNNSDGRQLFYFDSAPLMSRQKFTVGTNNGYLTEEIETHSTFEKIDVPAFNGSNHGIFLHDFESNLTAIIDSKHCFVMPLNRNRVLPPVSLLDFILKNNEGYYDVDTEAVRDTMRVVSPAVPNPEIFGRSISKECTGKKTYQLEKDSSRVQKRNAEIPTLFRAYAGKKLEVAIVNYKEAVENEV